MFPAPRPTTRSSARTARWRGSYHPDNNPDDPAAEAQFKEVVSLRDAARSRAPSPLRRLRRRRHARGRRPVAGGAGDPFGFGDLFDAFFGGDPFGGRGAGGPATRAPDAEAVVHLDLAQAAFGTTATVDVRLPVACSRCEGSGCEPGTHPARCDVCGGTGEVREVRRSILGQIVTASPCVACSATGSRIPTPCHECRGDGRVRSARSIDVEVPAGVDDGQRLRLVGQRPGRATRRRSPATSTSPCASRPTRASSATATTSCTCGGSRSRRPRWARASTSRRSKAPRS